MLYNVMMDILKMKYSSGSYLDSEHENNIKNILNSHGFRSSDIKMTKKEKELALENCGESSFIDNFEYVYQPCGKNNSPDFIVKQNDKLFFLECKTIDDGDKPVYNGGLPHEKYIYIFSSGKYNETTIFYGYHVVTKKMRDVYEKYLFMIKSIEKDFVNELENLGQDNPVGISYYVRSMYSHKGKQGKTNYFKNAERKRFEREVLDSVR